MLKDKLGTLRPPMYNVKYFKMNEQYLKYRDKLIDKTEKRKDSLIAKFSPRRTVAIKGGLNRGRNNMPFRTLDPLSGIHSQSLDVDAAFHDENEELESMLMPNLVMREEYRRESQSLDSSPSDLIQAELPKAIR